MSNEKFTDNEWYVELEKEKNEYGATGFDISSTGRKIHFISVWGESEDDEEAEANAKLIAAAPELLKGCRAAIAIFQSEGINESHPIVGEVFSQITSAVSKAVS